MLTLARFRAGRILLHLLAMLGDRCVRFHVAGIIRERELPSVLTAFDCTHGQLPLCQPPCHTEERADLFPSVARFCDREEFE
jgi:hypothetical protein